MKRHEFEHILRAAAGITGGDQFVVIGSQAILGYLPNPPAELVESVEADIFSFRSAEDADLIDGSIGEASPFHNTFGYYAHGVGEQTAILPAGWKERLVRFQTPNTGGATGLCLEVHDLAVSKLLAGRPKDYEFVTGLVRHRIAHLETIRTRLASTTVDDIRREVAQGRLDRIAAQSS